MTSQPSYSIQVGKGLPNRQKLLSSEFLMWKRILFSDRFKSAIQALALHSLRLGGKRISSPDQCKSLIQALLLHSLCLVGGRIPLSDRFKSVSQWKMRLSLHLRKGYQSPQMKSKRSSFKVNPGMPYLCLLNQRLRVKSRRSSSRFRRQSILLCKRRLGRVSRGFLAT